MIKILFAASLIIAVITQDSIICSGFIRIAKADRSDIKIDQIEMKLLGSNNKLIESIEISENGFYSIEIEDESQLLDYSIVTHPQVQGFVASPAQINLKFQHKTFDEASAFCNKQLNFSIKRASVDSNQNKQQELEQQRKTREQIERQQQEKLKQQQQEYEEQLRQQREQEQYEQIEQQLKLEQQLRLEQQKREQQQELEKQQELYQRQIEEAAIKDQLDILEQQEEINNVDEKAFDHFRLIGQFAFEGEFSQAEQALYSIKSFKVFDNLDEQVQDRTLYFYNYFEVETNEAKSLKLQLIVEKAKEKGESVAKQFSFEQTISKNQLLNRQLTNLPIIFTIKKEIQTKEQNKIASVVAPLLIFGLVLAMFNYDKILKKK